MRNDTHSSPPVLRSWSRGPSVLDALLRAIHLPIAFGARAAARPMRAGDLVQWMDRRSLHRRRLVRG